MARFRTVASSLAAIYALSILASVLCFRYVGEHWWITGIALYLPRALFALPLPFVLAALAATRPRWPFWLFPLASLGLLLILGGFVAVPSNQSATAGRPVVRILSYNVDSERDGDDKIVEEVLRYDAGIVLLEEMGSPEPLSGMLRSHYETVRATDQFLLATNYRLESTVTPDKLDYQKRLRSPRFVKYVLETPIGRVALYNVHPISPRESFHAVRGSQGLRHEILLGRVFSASNAESFYENSGLRVLQVQTFAGAAAAETVPVIIAGDTNLPGFSVFFRHYLSDYLDGFVEAGQGFGYTFPANKVPWMRIDRILADKQFRFVRFQVGSSHASDHLCVVADLQAANP